MNTLTQPCSENRETLPQPTATAAVVCSAVLGITDTDRMNWLEAQQPDTLIVENGVVSSTLRGAIDEAIKRERAAVKPNDEPSSGAKTQ
jgi:hypothetical protein